MTLFTMEVAEKGDNEAAVLVIPCDLDAKTRKTDAPVPRPAVNTLFPGPAS